MKRRILYGCSALAFLLAVGLMMYPVISRIQTKAEQDQVVVEWSEAVEEIKEEDTSLEWNKVESYNQSLMAAGSQIHTKIGDPKDATYVALLNTKDGVMGYLQIEKIGVQLPIYHGTGDQELAAGIGHLEGSSLPGTGVGTHCVLTGHSAMVTSKMLSDLNKLELGDEFVLYILDRTLRYRVDQIDVVLPSDSSLLKIDPKEDYVTIITCTPYGINTHRLCVRGRRVEDE